MTLLLSLCLDPWDLRLIQLLDHLFLLLIIIFLNNFSVWVSRTPTPRTKLSIDVPVDRIPDIKLRLENDYERISLSFLMYFMRSRSTS